MLMVKKALIYVTGLLFMAFGVAFSVNSSLGVSPVNSLPYVISRITGLDLGNCVIGIFAFYILVQILLLRKKFRPIDLTQLIFSTIFGRFVDVAKKVVGDFAIPTYPGQLVMLAISIVFVAIGVCLYMDVQLVSIRFMRPMPQGSFIDINAEVVHVGNTSMKIKITVMMDQDPEEEQVQTAEAFFTFVAVDENGKPHKVGRTL